MDFKTAGFPGAMGRREPEIALRMEDDGMEVCWGFRSNELHGNGMMMATSRCTTTSFSCINCVGSRNSPLSASILTITSHPSLDVYQSLFVFKFIPNVNS